MKNDFILTMVTCASAEEAKIIVRRLLEDRTIACGNIMEGVRSSFWWSGKIDRCEEVLVLMKTRKENFSKIEKTVKRLHSYDVPEIIAIPLVAGSGDYLKWIDKSLK